ncbi:MAG: DUF3526 domain-containing protein [Chryseolinea sp.]
MKSDLILLLARHFWNNAFSSKVIYVLMFVVCAVLVFAIFSGWEKYVIQNHITAKYQHKAYQDFVNNPDKHPHRMAHYGHFAFRQKSALSIFDHGLESFMGNSIYLEAHVQNTANFSNAGLSSGLLRFGEISVSMVLQVLLPLFIFFIGFDTVSNDRENGTLKILFSQGTNWKVLIMGKSLGLMAIVLAFLFPLLLAFIAISLFALHVQFSFDDGVRIALLALFYLIYLGLCSFITVLISAWSKNSKSSLVTLIGVWLVFAIVLPRSVQSLGTLFYQTPSKAAFTKSIEDDIMKEGDSHNPNDSHYKALKDSVLNAHHADSITQLPFNYGGFQIQEGERISATIYQQHYNKLLALYDKQNALSKSMGLINPFMAIKNISMSLSNTDYSSYLDFQRQAENYRYAFVSKMNDYHMNDIGNDDESTDGKALVSDHGRWGEVKKFEYRSGGVAEVFKTEGISILSFFCWSLLVVLCAYAFTKKLSVL